MVWCFYWLICCFIGCFGLVAGYSLGGLGSILLFRFFCSVFDFFGIAGASFAFVLFWFLMCFNGGCFWVKFFFQKGRTKRKDFNHGNISVSQVQLQLRSSTYSASCVSVSFEVCNVFHVFLFSLPANWLSHWLNQPELSAILWSQNRYPKIHGGGSLSFLQRFVKTKSKHQPVFFVSSLDHFPTPKHGPFYSDSTTNYSETRNK